MPHDESLEPFSSFGGQVSRYSCKYCVLSKVSYGLFLRRFSKRCLSINHAKREK